MAERTGGSFKTKTSKLEREVRKKKKKLEQLNRLEKRARDRWTNGYRAFLKAAQQLADIKVHKTQRETILKKKIKDWPVVNVGLTRERDERRAEIKTAEGELTELATKLAALKEQERNDLRNVNEIVTEVFDRNAAVVRAGVELRDYLTRQVFRRLFDDEGNLRRQVSFTSQDGLRRVTAMVNTMTKIDTESADKALKLIQTFFDRFKRETKINDAVKPLYDLTRELLVQKVDFKVGPDLYRFLSMDLDSEVFPELTEAQTLLQQSIRSEKTNSYIRIWEREGRTSSWVAVPQS